jgi:hypothetical protein
MLKMRELTSLQYIKSMNFLLTIILSLSLILNNNAFVLNGPNYQVRSAISDCRPHEGFNH